jgi:hypothetical protein
MADSITRVENHICAFALHTMYHNFVKISGAHRMTPAQAAGVDSRLWEVSDMVEMIEEWEVQAQFGGHMTDLDRFPREEGAMRIIEQGQRHYFILSLMGISIGALFCIGGFVLAILGVSGATEWVIQGSGLIARLSNASPGVVFGAAGMAIIWRYRPGLESTIHAPGFELHHS